MHERVDNAVMAAAPFASREHYARFLRFQQPPASARRGALCRPATCSPCCPILPAVRASPRSSAISPISALPLPDASEAAPRLPLPEALGWLYVVEGSNMGAAILAKEAVRLGLSDEFGARHLAGHADGRGLHWRRFTAALDAVALTPDEDLRAEAAAVAAFAHVLDLVGQELDAG